MEFTLSVEEKTSNLFSEQKGDNASLPPCTDAYSSSPYFSLLSDDILGYLLSHAQDDALVDQEMADPPGLTPWQIYAFLSVSHRWQRVLRTMPVHLSFRSADWLPPTRQAARRLCSHFGCLERLTVAHPFKSTLTKELLSLHEQKALPCLPMLESLRGASPEGSFLCFPLRRLLLACESCADTLQRFAYAHCLEELTLSGTRAISRADLEAVTEACPALQRLHILAMRADAAPRGGHQPVMFPKLTHLKAKNDQVLGLIEAPRLTSVEWASHVYPVPLERIHRSAPALLALHSTQPPASIDPIAQFRHLTSLTLKLTRDDRTYPLLLASSCPNLRELALTDSSAPQQKLIAPVVEHAYTFPYLQHYRAGSNACAVIALHAPVLTHATFMCQDVPPLAALAEKATKLVSFEVLPSRVNVHEAPCWEPEPDGWRAFVERCALEHVAITRPTGSMGRLHDMYRELCAARADTLRSMKLLVSESSFSIQEHLLACPRLQRLSLRVKEARPCRCQDDDLQRLPVLFPALEHIEMDCMASEAGVRAYCRAMGARTRFLGISIRGKRWWDHCPRL